MGNERLRTQLASAGLTVVDLAARVEVDPKTVERWISNGRVPHQRHRAVAARALGADEEYLWPDSVDQQRARSARHAELVGVYPTRGDVPTELWRRLIDQVAERVDVLVYAGLFLLDSHPDLPDTLIARAAEGLRGRFLYGDPASKTVGRRGEEEGIGAHLPARINLSLAYMRPTLKVPGLELRLHDSVLYNSIYRFDNEMLVNTHIAGSPAGGNPVLHLRSVDGGHLFESYLRSFDRVWAAAVTDV